MRLEYRFALGIAAAALVAVLVGVVVGPDRYPLLLVVAASGPLAVALAVAGRLQRPIPAVALAAGPLVGVLLAVTAHAAVAGFAYVFVAGLATAAAELADVLAADPRLVDVLASPWVIGALVSVVVVAPLVEEAGKAVGGRLAVPRSRADAFLAGIAAGAGFAVVENLAYAGLGSWVGGAWPEIALERSLGAVVHPLASALVLLGWWEARHGGGRRALLKGYLAGVAVHALWNGSLVAIAVVEAAFELDAVGDPVTTAGFGYLITMSLGMAAALWHVTRVVASDGDPLAPIGVADGRSLAAWTLVTASILVPVTILVVAFPGFYQG